MSETSKLLTAPLIAKEHHQEPPGTPAYVLYPKVLHCISSTVVVGLAVYEVVRMV